jgi:hypothetical protein
VLEQEKELKKVSGPPPAAMVIAVALLLAAGTGAFFWWQSQSRDREGPALTEDARLYLDLLSLSEVQMKAEESFLQHTVVVIEGKITNNGDRTVSLVEVNCVFREPYGLEVAREPAVIAGQKSGPLHPGETKSFRLAFDDLPDQWNQAMPSLFISQIQFE